MRGGIFLLLWVSLLGCGPTVGPPVSGTVYPSPRRATWGEEVRGILPWWAGSALSAKLAGVPLEVLRTEPDPAGGSGVSRKPWP